MKLRPGMFGPCIAGCNDIGLGDFAFWNGALAASLIFLPALLLKKHLCSTMQYGPTSLQSAVKHPPLK